jgi:hypothetical protein
MYTLHISALINSISTPELIFYPAVYYKEMKASPFRAGVKNLNILKNIFFLSMAITLLPSSIEGFMGLREKHSAYRIPLILFFNEGSPFNNFKISGPEKIFKWGWFSVPPYCPSNARCNSESMRGTMNRFEKVTLDLFKAGRKSV